jgi:hypothetical protein
VADVRDGLIGFLRVYCLKKDSCAEAGFRYAFRRFHDGRHIRRPDESFRCAHVSAASNLENVSCSVYSRLSFRSGSWGRTVFFLWFFSRPMLEKLDRIKVKYGLIE